MRLRSMWVSVLGLTLAASVVACGGGSKETAAPAETAGAPAGGGQKVDPATAGEVNGVVAFEGTAPKNEPIKMNADPVCVKANTTPQEQETYLVADGKLANVFVYVKDGLSAYSFDAPTGMLTFDQKNCRYHPHVFGVRVGQEIEINNGDATLHNIHALPKANAEFNTAQPLQNMKMNHKFDKAGTLIAAFKEKYASDPIFSKGIADLEERSKTDRDDYFTGLVPTRLRDAVKDAMRGRTAMMLGHSGVGMNASSLPAGDTTWMPWTAGESAGTARYRLPSRSTVIPSGPMPGAKSMTVRRPFTVPSGARL